MGILDVPGISRVQAIAAFARVAAFDVRAFGAIGDGVANDAPAIQAVIDAATVLAAKPVVYFPKGTYRLDSALRPYSNMTFAGDGMGTTVLKSYKQDGPVWWLPVEEFSGFGSTAAAPNENITWRDMTIDGYSMTLAGAYSAGAKGFVGMFAKNCTWLNVAVLGTPATGFGVDFLAGCAFINCLAEDCGRLNSGYGANDPGGAGFGIGTGGYANESHQLIGCTARGNGTFGYFAERQDGANNLFSAYGKIIGGHFEDNGIANIANAGSKRWSVIGATLHGSQYGIAFMPRLTDSLGIEATVSDVIQAGAAQHGFHLTYPQNTQSGRLTLQVRGGKYGFNGGDGIHVETVAGQTLTGLDILDPMVYENSGAGVALTGGGTVQKGRISVHAFNNGTGDGAAASTAGVALTCTAVTDISVRGSKMYDLNTTKHQQYGVAFGASTVATRCVVKDNEVVGNGTAGVLPPAAGGSTGNAIEANPGYNPLGPQDITLGASPFTYTAGPQTEDVFIMGGTVTNVAISGSNVATSGSSSIAPHMTFTLPPGGQIVVTYSAAPIMKKYRR